MKSRYQALVQERADKLKASAPLDDPQATPEQITTAKDALTRVKEIDAELPELEALREAQRNATTGALGVQVTDRGEQDPKRGFATLADFAKAVRAATGGDRTPVVDPRLLASQAISAALSGNMETHGSVGEGYDIPPEFRQEIFKLMFAGPSLLSLLNVEPTNSNQVRLIKDENTPWGATGVQAYWHAEGGQLTASKLATKGMNVELHELAAYVIATEELLEDAPRLNSRLSQSAADALAFKASDAIFGGTGVGMPLGFAHANNAALVSVAKEGSQAADTLVAANLAKTYSRLINPGKSVLLCNQDTLPQFLTMTLANQPIWTPPSSGFVNAPGGFLFGRPILFTEHNATLGDKTDIVWFDPSGYFATMKNGGVKFAESIHLFFDYNARCFRWLMRFGGQPYLSAAVSPKNGSATKSHFVTLDARA